MSSSDYNAMGGGIYMSAGTLSINSSTLEGNAAVGGGVYPTPSGSVPTGGQGGNGQGGGLYIAAGTVTIDNSTIADNHADGGSAYLGSPGTGSGGGIYNAAGPGALHMYDTILADNSATTAGADLAGSLTSLGHNLIGNSTGGSGFAASDLVNVDPLLGLLQNNGGSTQTMALLPGSPAIDAGDNTNAPADDQRGFGFPRIVGSAIDIGAFEVQAAPPPVTPALIQVGPAYGLSTGGTTVTIAGANLGTPATATVDFGSNNPATIVSDNGTQLVVVDPSGSGTVDVTVTTAAGTSATSSADQFTYVSPVTLSPSTLPVATANQSYSATIMASGGSGSYTFALALGSSLPAGLNLSSSGILAGTMPTAGSYTFTVVASDTFYTGVSGSQQYTLTVKPAGTLTLSPTSLPTATVGDSYGPVTITASGGSGSYTFALASGSNLPAGLTLTGAGVLSGKPTTSTGSPFRFTITATDKSYSGLTGSTAYTLTVDPAITVSPATLPAATATDAVNDKLTAKGGSGAGYTFALASGSSLPNGLTLTSAGTITGTPTQPGKYAFTIVATDSIGATGTQACSLTVGTPPNALTVTNTNDHGSGSLRAEIAAAKSGAIILFAPTLDGKTITLTSGELDLTKNVTILGAGAGQLTIIGHVYGGSFASRIFEVAPHTTVTLSGLTISGASGYGSAAWDGYGGGILPSSIQRRKRLMGISVLRLQPRTKSTIWSRMSWGTQHSFRAPQVLFLTWCAPP